MSELLCFLAGYVISGTVSIVLLSLIQINRMRENNNLVKKPSQIRADNRGLQGRIR